MACEHNGDIVTQDDYRKPMNEMGEAGMAASENIRKVKERSIKVKEDDTDKEHRIFESQDDAIEFGKTLGVNFRKRFTCIATNELLQNGENPSSEYLFQRMWGLDKKSLARMIPTIDNKWCVYWRPSHIKINK